MTFLEGTGLTAQLLKVLIAYLLALPTGLERFKHDRSAGLRTFSATVAFRVRRN